MDTNIPESILSQISEFVGARIGLHFPKERWRDLQRGINLAAAESGLKNISEFIDRLLSSPLRKDQIEILASYLTVGETYFYRDQHCFKALEEHILPNLIQPKRSNNKRLRIWSAGCCTGEEAYSIAMVLRNTLPDLAEWDVSLLATDINPRFLRKAAEGVYGEWSFRETPDWVKERYCREARQRRYELYDSIKSMVTFSYLNLVEDRYPSLLTNTNALDLIFCRNVLMYFTPKQAKNVIKKLHSCLVDGGWLVVSPSEASQSLFSEFRSVNLPGTTFYRKDLTKGSKDFSFQAEVQQSSGREPTYPAFDLQEIDQGMCDPSLHKPSEPDEESQSLAPIDDPLTEAFIESEGPHEEAAAEILERLSKHPSDTESLALLARAYANEGRLKEAFDVCQKAIEVDKLNPTSHFLLATILQELGHTKGAVNSLKKVIYLDRSHVLAHFLLGNLTWQHGRIRESKKHFENALALLTNYPSDENLSESGGMSAGRVVEVIESIMQKDFFDEAKQ